MPQDTTSLRTLQSENLALDHRFPYAGAVNGSSLDAVGSNGYYWSRTACSADNAYYLRFGSSGVNPANYSNRYRGFSVRCVATT